MNRLKLLSIIIILAGLFGCEPSVTFTEPQPTDTDNLKKFPKRLQGHYLSLSDSSTIAIEGKLIQRIYDFDYKIHPNQLDSTSRISGNTLLSLNIGEGVIVERDGDSLILHIHKTDTIFQIDSDNVVRKYKGYYFLNSRADEAGWSVKKVHLSKGQLLFSGISTKQELEKLKEITETPQDTVQTYKFTATKKQFEEFIKNEGFSDSEIFVKQKNAP